MQQSWRADSDKLTFISCFPHTNHMSSEEIHAMLGDVNLFIATNEEENGDVLLVGEIELMIALKENQRHGLGRAALLIFLNYVLRHQSEILQEYFTSPREQAQVSQFAYLRIKARETNVRSIALFESLGFKKTEQSPNFFDEFELRNPRLRLDQIERWMEERGIYGYREVPYTAAGQIKQEDSQEKGPSQDSVIESLESGTNSFNSTQG